MKLENCKKDQGAKGTMDWIPWVIAGVELLVIIYLLVRKRK
jgi:hypothetical protein